MNNEHGSQNKADNSAPLVSISCITFNHEQFIAQAIDGFLMQKTTFPIEILIHDDASTDNTANIIREYESKYPEIIKPIYETENQWEKGERGSEVFNFPRAQGKYIAICEGDDYWIDSQKLSKQVMFMMQHPNLSMSFHAVRIDYADSSRGSKIHRHKGRQFFKAKEVILGGGSFYPTCSVMFRKDVIENLPTSFLTSTGQVPLVLNAVTKGDVGYIDEIMAVRNVHVPGSWTKKMTESNFDQKIDFLIKVEMMLNAFNKHTGFKFKRVIKKKISIAVRHLLIAAILNREDRKKNYEFLKKRMLLTDRFLAYIGCLFNFAVLRRKLKLLRSVKKEQ